MAGKQLGWDSAYLRCSIKVVGVFALDGHVVGLAHFELDEAVDCVILYDVGWVKNGVLRARAVRLAMLDRP